MTACILIIANHPGIQELMAYLLERSGYHVLLAKTGEKGIELAQREKFDLYLCVIHKSGIDGYEFARRLKDDSKCYQIPLVAVTASIDPSERNQMLAAGFDGCVAITMATPLFVEQVQSFLDDRAQVHPQVASAFIQPGEQ